MSRELIIHCHSSHGDADAELLLEKLPYFTSGTMYLVDKFFCRFVLSKTSYTKSIHPYPVLAFMLFCPKPFWYDLTAQSFCINGFAQKGITVRKHCIRKPSMVIVNDLRR